MKKFLALSLALAMSLSLAACGRSAAADGVFTCGMYVVCGMAEELAFRGYLWEHTQRLRVEVADDGVGFDTAERPPGHYGVRGMQEQAALIGARLELISRPGHGTRLVFEFDA